MRCVAKVNIFGKQMIEPCEEMDTETFHSPTGSEACRVQPAHCLHHEPVYDTADAPGDGEVHGSEEVHD